MAHSPACCWSKSSVAGHPLYLRRPAFTCRPSRVATLTVARKPDPTKPPKLSRIGKLPIPVPKTVQINIDGQTVRVKGPKGELINTFSEKIEIKQDTPEVIRCNLREISRNANCLHGLTRTLINNMVVGTSTGYSKELTMIGVGYRAALAGKDLSISIGYSHPVLIPIPEGIKVEVEKNTVIKISGYDKVKVGDFAATVRSKREPEPYKGKGIRYTDEVVRRKEGKRGK